ncbi:hypothetical protein M0802_008048 [Mischocyttarus mexicanus]|nr:hypothetical protein M0802_008048 [Mischocyttarus mexicanus]
MDEIQYQYIRYNKYLMNVLGQWPSQSAIERFLISVVFVPTIAAQLILQGGGLMCAIVDIDVFMEGVAPFIISFMCLAKYINFVYNFEEMKDLFTTMQKDWKFYMKYDYEFNILCRYYEVGKKATFAYSATVYGLMLPFMMVPGLINLANVLGVLNSTDDKPLLYRVEYFVDVETYYYPLLIQSYFGTIGYITIVVGIDTINLFYVQHGCALCEILGYYLENIVDNDNLEIDLIPNLYDDKAHYAMKECIKLHNHVIQYANKLENTWTISHFFQLMFNMIGISFTGYQAAMKMDEPDVALGYGGFTLTLTFVVFLESWPGQQLTDHTDRISEYAARGKWYQTSFATRTDLNIMLMRCLKPIQLTAGKLYVLNLENFSRGGGMIAAWNYDSDIALENFAPFLVSLMIVVKIVNFIFNSAKMKKLLVTMQDDWRMAMKKDEEIRILRDYYSIGTLLSKGYAVCVYGSMMPFLMVPVMTLSSRFLGLAGNETEQYPLIFHAEYFVNIEKYYYFVLIHSYFASIGFCAAVVGIDTMFVFYVQHICGIIMILGNRLENVIKDGDMDVDIYPDKANDKTSKIAGDCVVLHNHILQYSQMIESANTMSFFVQLGLNMVCISFTGFQAVMHLNKPDEALRYGSFAMAQTCHLLFESLPAQQLYDHSIRVCEYAGNGNWYRASLRTRKILNFMILRSQKPIQLTAGKLYILNLENFSSVRNKNTNRKL